MACLLVAVLLAAGRARADDARPLGNLVGDSALGMGGTFTGLADDPSAAYYNPAGLSVMTRRSVSASMQLDAFERIDIDRAFEGVASGDFVYDARVSVPVFVSAVAKFGRPEGDDRFRRHAVAFSTFHPHRRTTDFALSTRAAMANNGVTRFDDFEVRRTDNTVWTGVSYAYATARDAGYGLSLFWSDRSFAHRESRTEADEVGGDMVTGNTDAFLVRTSVARLQAQHLVLRLGGLHRLRQRLRLGWMVQPPGLGLDTDSERQFQRFSRSEDGVGVFHEAIDGRGLPAAAPVPWALRLGLGYTWSERTRLGLDVSLHGPAGRADDPVVRFGTGGRSDLGPAGIFVAERYYRGIVPNVSLGAETTVARMLTLRGGLFTDLSGAPEVKAADAYPQADVSRFGVSGSVGLTLDEFEVSLGGFLRWGRGTAAGIDTDPNASSFYVPRRIEDRTIGFFISGHLSAATKLLEREADRFFGEAPHEGTDTQPADDIDGGRAAPDAAADEPAAGTGAPAGR